MLTVKHVLESKAKPFNTVTSDTMVIDALNMLNSVNLSYLIVMEGDEYKGIFSERDYSRNVILKGRASNSTRSGASRAGGGIRSLKEEPEMEMATSSRSGSAGKKTTTPARGSAGTAAPRAADAARSSTGSGRTTSSSRKATAENRSAGRNAGTGGRTSGTGSRGGNSGRGNSRGR